MTDIHDPRTWTWMDRPESLADPFQMVQLVCPHEKTRRCEYRVRIHRKAVDFTLREHLEKSCPLRSDPGYVVPAGLKPFSELA